MQLFYSGTSPYVRKVSVTAMELGLDDQLERVSVDPWSQPEDLLAQNPLSKVPCLITDAGDVLFDSPVICEYLDSLNAAPGLVPATGSDRWQSQTLCALADGVLDAAVLVFLEQAKRPPELSWDWWLDLQMGTVERSLQALNNAVSDFPDKVDQVQINTAVALGYCDFRLPDYDWRGACPALAEFYDYFSQRPSMVATLPRVPAA